MVQVRQQLYRGSMLRFRRYARHLAPLLRPLRQLIARYEAEAGLESSEALLEEVLGREASQQQEAAELGEDEFDGNGDDDEDEVAERQDAQPDGGGSSGSESSRDSGGGGGARDEL